MKRTEEERKEYERLRIAEYRRKHPERTKAANKKWRDLHGKEYQRQYYLKRKSEGK